MCASSNNLCKKLKDRQKCDDGGAILRIVLFMFPEKEFNLNAVSLRLLSEFKIKIQSFCDNEYKPWH